MSLTNPKNVVTEERLAEFYNQILPYLGGMPDILANKFSKGDLYSTDEKMIGQWIDGKPLYQKTVYTTSLNASGTDTVISHGISNLDHVINAFGYTYGGAGTSRRSALSPYYNNGNWQCSFYVNDISVVIQVGTSFYNAHKDHGAYVTIQYTKTTDSAISIGNDTDYSTTENIVGTWIDGKPIYQKTIDCGALPNNTTKQVNHNISNIELVISVFAISYDSNKSNMLCIPYLQPKTIANSVGISANNTIIGIISGSDRSSFTTTMATIQYTKTTD